MIHERLLQQREFILERLRFNRLRLTAASAADRDRIIQELWATEKELLGVEDLLRGGR